MLVKFRYINGRIYVNNESFVNCIFSQFSKISGAVFRFNKITHNNICKLEFGNTSFDKNLYNVTGNITTDGTVFYFGFLDTGDKEPNDVTLDEHVTLNSVLISDMAWVFTSFFKNRCKEFYNPDTQKLLMASIEFVNMDLLEDVCDFSFELKVSDSRLQGIFSYKGHVVCKELILVRDKNEYTVG